MEKWYTTGQAGKRLYGYSAQTVRNLIENGKIGYKKQGNLYKISEHDIDYYKNKLEGLIKE